MGVVLEDLHELTVCLGQGSLELLEASMGKSDPEFCLESRI